jgi:hypothetical protein
MKTETRTGARRFPPPGFGEFIAPGADRLAFIVSRLETARVPHSVLSMAGSRNVIVRYGKHAYSGRREKCLSAHYDRHPGSPGANDNSAACFQLLSFAEELLGFRGAHDCMIAFTDNEEMAGKGRSSAQGSFAIAEGFRRSGLPGPWAFAFDCTGRGGLPVLSSSIFSPLPRSPLPGGLETAGTFKRRVLPLHRFTAGILDAAFPGSWLSLPTPYSENLGYITGGLAAVALTFLPRAESLAFARALAENPLIEHILLRNEFRTVEGRRILDAAMPATWKLIHGKGDSPATLDAESFVTMRTLLGAIASARTPAVRAKSDKERV